MSNKNKNTVVSIVMILFFLCTSAFCWLKPSDAYSNSERRSLAQFPDITSDNILSGKFMTEFENYSLDQFPMRNAFRTLKALTNSYVLNQSDNNGIYVKDGYISKIEYPLNSESISYAAKRFKYVNDKYFAGTNINAYLSIVPDKNYFLKYGEYLSIDYDKLIFEMTEQTGFLEYIDITDSLTLDSYYKTDTHWRQEKLIPVAKKIANKMGANLSAEYREEVLDNDFYGVYYGQAALPLEAEKIRYLTNDILESAKVYDYQNGKEMQIYDMEKAFDKDPYEMFLAGSLSLISIENEQASTEKELVIFRDSFGSSIAPLFVECYRKITVVDIRYIHPNMLEKFIEFDNQDVLFLYSALVLNNSEVIK